METGLADEVRIVFQTHRRRYGSRRIRAELKERAYKAGRHKIRKLLKEQGLKAIQSPRRFTAADLFISMDGPI
ncbi:IS3 family transposase [Runella defluvii]|uniref:IS3 family transposase n=1 Tax=Runella defluvii TaxID=370973 RepID=UPI0016174ECA